MKYSHLGRCASVGILLSNPFEFDPVAVERSDLIAPSLEFRASPFKTVVLMPELARWQVFPNTVVFFVWSGQDHMLGSCLHEEGIGE